jgi:hypothetical protein
MLLENHTPAQAMFQCVDFGTDDRYGVVIWKLTYDLSTTNTSDIWVLSSDPMPIVAEPLETQFGMFHGDIFLGKAGVDLCVLGHLWLSRPALQTTVTLRCGSFAHTLLVTGDRVWEVGSRGLVPSRPLPFTKMDLSYARAYGGVTQYEGMPVQYEDNPVGRGYYLDRDAAIGAPLPNIETTPMQCWDERPPPAGWGPYPMHWGLRARTAVSVDPDLNVISNISPAAFNNAHPQLVVPTVVPGQTFELFGVYDQRVSFALPRTTGNVHVRVGEQRFDVPTVIDGIYLWLDANRLVITQRANFHYVLRPEQIRVATLTVVHE